MPQLQSPRCLKALFERKEQEFPYNNRQSSCMCCLIREKCDDDDDEDEDNDDTDDDGGNGEGIGEGHRRGTKELSYLVLCLQVEQGVVSMFPELGAVGSEDSDLTSTTGADPATLMDDVGPSSSSGHASAEVLVDVGPNSSEDGSPELVKHGVALMDIANIWGCYVSRFKGDPTHDYACGWVQDLAFYHHGNLDDAEYRCVDDTFDLSACDRLLPLFGPGSGRLEETAPQPMISVAMEMNWDERHSTKTSKLALSFSNIALFYHLTPPGLGAIEQLSNFFDLNNEVVAGYESPSVVTELHVHINSCTVEYKPLYLPLKATMLFDSVNMSTSVVTGAPVHVVRVVLDGFYVLLAAKQTRGGQSSGDFGHSVCVMEVEWFELTVRLCNSSLLNEDFQELFAKMPEVTMECASNIVHFRMCVDSCIALRDLLIYLSAQQDLHPPPHSDPSDLWDYSSLPATSGMIPEREDGEPPPLTLAPAEKEDTHIGDLITDAMEESPPSSSKTRPLISGQMVKIGGRPPQSSAASRMKVEVTGQSLLMDFLSDSEDEGVGRKEVKKPSRSPPDTLGKMSGSDQGGMFSDGDDDFCIVSTPTSTKVAPGAAPKIKCLLGDGEELELMEDHFSIPDGQLDQLQRPRSFPEPLMQYTLKEMTLVWHLYGGKDFEQQGNVGQWRRKQVSLASWQHRECCVMSSKLGGGPARDHSVLVEVELGKVRLQQETYPSDKEQASRLVLLVGDVEVRDRLAQSHINKLLYHYTTEAMPKQSHASMVTLKVLFTRPDLQSLPDCTEAAVHLSVLPIRLNLDQDTVLFVHNFVKQVLDSTSHLLASVIPETQEGPPAPANVTTETNSADLEGAKTESAASQVFIRSFVFQPDLPIRIDYEAKGFKTEIGTLTGILLGLSHLNNSEVNLKALHYKKGLLGWDKLLEYCTTEWLMDIKGYQLPLLLKGVGPMHNVTQLVYGLVDFVRLPYQQYQEDGRLVWGIQRGTSALTSSTGVAVVELTSQLLEAVQSLAQLAYDMVTPGEASSAETFTHQHKPHQPLDFREGFSNAYDVVYAGIGGTAADLYGVATKEHNERGVAGAVGGVLRHLPGTFVKPIILASEATRQVLGGVKNQFVPDARKEAHEKWKSNEDNDEHEST